jgi:hypothetical protein
MELVSIKDWHYPTLFVASPNEADATVAQQINISNGLGANNTEQLTKDEQTLVHTDYQGYNAKVAHWLQVKVSGTWKTVARIQWLDRTSGTISSASPAYALISEVQDTISTNVNTGYFKEGTVWRQTPIQKGVLAYKAYVVGSAVLCANVIDTVNTTINSSVTSFIISHNVKANFGLNARIKIDSEIMIITALTDNTTLNVQRAQEGTSAASHAYNAVINVTIPQDETTSFDVESGHEIENGNLLAIECAHFGYTEVMRVTGVAGDTITVVRGLSDTVYADNDPTTIALPAETQLAEVLDTSETEIDVSSGTPFEDGDTITIDEEDMTITGIATNTLTVTRGANSTTAAGHDNSTKIYKKAVELYKGGESVDLKYPSFVLKERPMQSMNNIKKATELNIQTVNKPKAIRQEVAAALYRGNNTTSQILKFRTYEKPTWYVDDSPSAVAADTPQTGITKITASTNTILYGLDRGMSLVKLDSSSNPTTTYGYVACLVSNSTTSILETVLNTGSISASDTVRYYIPVRVGDSLYVKNNTANISANAIVLGTVFTEGNGVQTTNWTVSTAGSSFKRYRHLLSNLATKQDISGLRRVIKAHTHDSPFITFPLVSNGDAQIDWTPAGELRIGTKSISIAAGTTASTMVNDADGNTGQSSTPLATDEYLIYWPGTGTALKTIKRKNYVNVEGNNDVVIARCADRSGAGAKYVMTIDIDLRASATGAITNT